jgi:hypothetical protein
MRSHDDAWHADLLRVIERYGEAFEDGSAAMIPQGVKEFERATSLARGTGEPHSLGAFGLDARDHD